MQFRFRKHGEKFEGEETIGKGVSWFDWFEALGGIWTPVITRGRIGYSGTKTHVFEAQILVKNGERIALSFNSICGSEGYRSGVSFTKSEAITCAKCAKKAAKFADYYAERTAKAEAAIAAALEAGK